MENSLCFCTGDEPVFTMPETAAQKCKLQSIKNMCSFVQSSATLGGFYANTRHIFFTLYPWAGLLCLCCQHYCPTKDKLTLIAHRYRRLKVLTFTERHLLIITTTGAWGARILFWVSSINSQWKHQTMSPSISSANDMLQYILTCCTTLYPHCDQTLSDLVNEVDFKGRMRSRKEVGPLSDDGVPIVILQSIPCPLPLCSTSPLPAGSESCSCVCLVG